jgi:hypothetical protein
MPEHTLTRPITIDRLREALNLLCYHHGATVAEPEPVCDWPKLCGPSCRFPRYYRTGPAGLTARTLIEVGYPTDLLKDLDCEYEVGEVLHPGVKIGRSRNAALTRLGYPGVALLSFVQDHSTIGWSYNKIVLAAFRPRRTIKRLDARRRPWLY